MGKKDGFISIIALIIMSVLLVMVLYLGYTSKLEYLILNASNSKNQGYYQSEGKIYLSLYDENYYTNQLYLNIIDVFRNNKLSDKSKVVIIDDEDLDFGDSLRNVKLEFIEQNNRVRMDMIAESNNNGIVSKITSSGTLVNEIFESEYLILSYETVDEKHKEELGKILLEINEGINVDNCYKPGSLFGIDTNQYNKIILKKKDANNYELSCKREVMINPYVTGYSGREAIIIARKPEDTELDFYIGDSDNLSGDMELSGILYVNGNIIISNYVNFKGILILENGEIIINTSKKPKISGMVIINNMENYDEFIEKVDIIRDKRMIYRYGTYLPGFLDPKISVIKSN